MKGHIYKVVNIVNNKVYIGKTLCDVRTRWDRHISDAFRVNPDGEYKYNFKFYRAIRKYGVDKFKVYDLGEFSEDKLNDLEKIAIAKFDSYSNGYNSTLGGDGNKTSRDLSEEDEEIIIDLYRDNNKANQISQALGLPLRTILKVLRDRIPNEVRNNLNKQKAVAILDTCGNALIKFDSVAEAHRWLETSLNKEIKDTNVYYLIKKAALNGNTAYGYHWKFV